MPLRCLYYRLLWYNNRIWAGCSNYPYTYKLTRTQNILRIRNLRAYEEGSRFFAKQWSSESHAALFRENRTVRQNQLHFEIVLWWEFQKSLSNLISILQHVVFRNTEVDPHWSYYGHSRQQAVWPR